MKALTVSADRLGCRICGCDLLRLERRAGLCVRCVPEAPAPQAHQGPGYPARGFDRWPRERRRLIAGQGGTRAHQLKRAHEWTSAEAQAAGRRSWIVRRQRQAA